MSSLTLEAIAGPVSRETEMALHAYDALLRRWTSSVNLIAPSTAGTSWTRHILDSLQLAPLATWPSVWLDIGSGGGFPGGPLAVLAAERGGQVHLCESNRKKAAFLQLALRGMPATVHAVRIQALALPKRPDYISARAFAPLNEILALAARWLTDGSVGLFHKGRDYRAEIETASQQWDFDLVIHASRVDPDGVIVQIENLKPRS